MSHLPPRPAFEDYPPGYYPPDDRRRPAPMAPDRRYDYSRRDDEYPRDRAPGRGREAYPPSDTPSRRGSAPYAYGSEDEEYRRRYREWEEDRRLWEWEQSERERLDRDYRRPVDYGRDRFDDRAYRGRDSRYEGRRGRRLSPSPPRRAAGYAGESSHRLPSRSPPPRSPRSPARSGRSVSRAASPVKLGNHSITTSPRSPVRSRSRRVLDTYVPSRRDTSAPRRNERPVDTWRPATPPPRASRGDTWIPPRSGGSPRRSASPRRRDISRRRDTPPRRRSITPPPRPASMKRERSLSRSRPRPFPVKAEPRPTSPLKRERSPSVPRAREASVKKRSPSPRRSPPPVQPPVPKIEATEVPLPAASEPPILNKGKAKAEPPAEPDVKMRSPSPPPAQVRAAAPPSQPRIFHRRTSRSPPRGPRDHDTFARPHAPTEESKPSPNPPPSRAPLADLADRIPTLPPHKPRPNPIQEIEAELKRIEATRAHLAAERVRTLRATRRAQHELDLVSIDLRMAEGRRRVADQQVEQARIGQLGIDAAK